MHWVMKLRSLKGLYAERYALKHLQQKGLRLITKNYACRLGEIDIIMLDEDVIVFVEVRFRSNVQFGTAAETISLQKRKKIVATALFFLTKKYGQKYAGYRFDVITMSPDSTKKTYEVNWLQNAFTKYGKFI